MNIRLCTMTAALARRYFADFELDPILFIDKSQYQPYEYSTEKSDATVARYRQLGRIYLAIMLDDEPIGEIILKQIDYEKKHCTIGISMKSDNYKNRGYGTQAEILALEHIFEIMQLEHVYADTILRNARSQHVLRKVGFTEIGRDDTFIYYRCDKSSWNRPNIAWRANHVF